MQTNNYELAIDIADEIRTLVSLPGWERLASYLEDRKRYFIGMALTAKKLEDIYYAQANVSAISNLLTEFESLVGQGDELKKQGE